MADPGWARSVVPLSCVILFGLFALQSRGTGTVGKFFGPIMVVWFVTLGALGLYHIAFNPEILRAISPHYAWEYFARHGWPGFHILASVVLAVSTVISGFAATQGVQIPIINQDKTNGVKVVSSDAVAPAVNAPLP